MDTHTHRHTHTGSVLSWRLQVSMVTNKTLSKKQHYGLRADRNLIYLPVSSEINSGVLMEQKSKKYNLCERECVC